MRYMMLVTADESVELGEEAGNAVTEAAIKWVAEMDGRGVRVQGNRLRATSDATTVRVRDGEVLLLDGPFAETKEQIAGYDIIECADLDEAIEVASKHPVAKYGAIEVRPFWD
ncbi:YciI family protein [Phytohabitans flavus]|uniref:Transcription initiation protein n=1 Tax=Phytohabitans flavus TaxID=1076124 RepID=A0A6F8XY48_9ACTN|nr:YciI family protein [Phytohabitans flavus]BCB78766.1 transcription initiation protein [Phytohabitans flavus]